MINSGIFVGFMATNTTIPEAQTTLEVCVFVEGTFDNVNDVILSVFTVDIMSATGNH